MSNSSRNARFCNYPNPRANEAVYQAPPPPKNPVIKGSTLHYLSNLYVQQHDANAQKLTSTVLQRYPSSSIYYGAMRALARSAAARRLLMQSRALILPSYLSPSPATKLL